MAIQRLLREEVLTKLRSALLRRTRSYDTAYGLLPDLFNALAEVLVEQNNERVLTISDLLTLANPEELNDNELDARVLSEGIVRPRATPSVTVLTFERETPISTTDVIRIPRGYPVATAPGDDSTIATFVTTEDITIGPNGNIPGEVDPVDGGTYYRVRVPAIATSVGLQTSVGPRRITRPLRPLAYFARVYNAEGATGARDSYTNTEVVELHRLALTGRQLSTPNGAQFYVQSSFSDVSDALVVHGDDPLLTRAASDAGAVDVFVLGETSVAAVDTIFYLGVAQLHPISFAPLLAVSAVTLTQAAVNNGGPTTLTEGVDYEVVRDAEGLGGSVRARDGVRFLSTGTVTQYPVGSTVTINYTYNNLIRTLQSDNERPEVFVLGSDKLYRQAVTVETYLSARLTVLSGFSFASVEALVRDQVLQFFNELELGDDVEISDIQQRVRQLSGVDNFVVTRLVRDADIAGVGDITIAGNEKARLLTANLIII
jgi:hypothetical protein